MTVADDPDHLRSWIGREQTITDTIDPATMHRLALTLGHSTGPAAGDPLPAMWHVAAFVEIAPHGQLGPDGHPRRGGFLPPVSLPRRMWAGSRITFHEPLRIGDHAVRTSRIDAVTPKEGASGSLCFVTVHHTITVDDHTCIVEEQDLVYRDDPDPSAPKRPGRPAPTEAEESRTVVPSEVQLFRYSAVTFNGHRIHYDRRYAHDVEGYDGLVVHGPLTATLLAALAAEHHGPLATFAFRGVAPLLDTAPFTIHRAAAAGNGTDLWATAPDGTLAMTAEATFG